MWPAPNPLSLNALSMNCFFWANAGYWLNSLFMAGLDFCPPRAYNNPMNVQGKQPHLRVLIIGRLSGPAKSYGRDGSRLLIMKPTAMLELAPHVRTIRP